MTELASPTASARCDGASKVSVIGRAPRLRSLAAYSLSWTADRVTSQCMSRKQKKTDMHQKIPKNSGLPYSSWTLLAGGFGLISIGLYFVFIRPALLGEDLRYMDTTLEHVVAVIPGLLNWLPKVFIVFGGYVISTGLQTCYLALTGVRTRAAGAITLACISGAVSIGLMVAINFTILSDFRWVLLLVALPWPAAALFYFRRK